MLCLDLDSDLRSNVHLSIITPAMASCARYHCSITPRFCVSLGVLSSEDLPRPLCVGYRRIYSTIAPTLFVSTTSAEAFLSSSDAPLYSFPQKVRVLEIPLQSPKARPAFQRTTVYSSALLNHLFPLSLNPHIFVSIRSVHPDSYNYHPGRFQSAVFC